MYTSDAREAARIKLEKDFKLAAQGGPSAQLYAVMRLIDLQCRINELEDTVRELLKYGEHDGDCNNQSESGPCTLHLAASDRRETQARQVLESRL